MSVTRIVTAALLFAGISTMIIYAVTVCLQALGRKSDRVFHRYLRRLRAEQYPQLVVLPLYGAIVGGLVSEAISIVVSDPSGKYSSLEIYILLVLALVVGVGGPLWTNALYANPENLPIGQRIDKIKNGDWTRDTKADIIGTIDKDSARITEKLESKGIWFFALSVFLIASDINGLIHDKHIVSIRTVVLEAIAIAAIIGGLIARYGVRRKSLRSALKDLGSYRAEAVALSPPAPTTPPSRAGAVHRHHDHHHDLSIAIGGLFVGAILARLGALRSRGVQRS
jgi:hypothetical protein